MKYEICSITYNLAILSYLSGHNYLLKNTNEDRKVALQKFRFGLWAIDQLKNNVTSLLPEI